jgi:UDP-N-acetylglucosamine acyltransferase
LGEGNDIGMGVVLGERPQHLAYDGTETLTEIGNFNTFREYATVHRPMPGGRTVIGDRNLFMTGAHVAHDCVVGNDVIMVNNSAAAGHVVVNDRAFVSAHAMVHQHCRVGSLAMLSGASASTMDVPPFWIMQRFNVVCGVNVVGMKRAGIPPLEIMAVRKAFKMIYVEKRGLREATDLIEAELGHHAAIRTLVEFLRVPGRGIPGAARYDRNLGMAEAA